MTAAARHMGGGYFDVWFNCPGCGLEFAKRDIDPSRHGVTPAHDRIKFECGRCGGMWAYAGLFNAAIKAWAALAPPEERRAG